MSLVGSELNLVLDFDDLIVEVPSQTDEKDVGEEDELDMGNAQNNRIESGQEVEEEDAHPTLTPKSSVENFFLGGLPTHTISAAALAEEISIRHKPIIGGGLPSSSSSVGNWTAPTNLSDYPLTVESEVSGKPTQQAAALDPQQPWIPSTVATTYSKPNNNKSIDNNNMTSTTTTTPTSQGLTSTTTTTTAPESMHVDAAEKIYSTVKGAWGWGKSVIIFSPFLGMAESIAGKVVETAVGSSLQGVDDSVTGQLQALDERVLNPAIQLMVRTVQGAASQTESFFKPIILTILKPLDFMIKNRAENTTTTTEEPKPDAVPNL